MKVITSEYAKEMAHNLDDLRERWALRKQSQNYVLKIKEPARFGVDYFYVPPKTDHLKIFDQLADLNANIRKYKNEVDQIQAELGDKNVTDEKGKRLNPRQYHARRQALIEEMNYKLKLHRYLRYVEKCYHMNRDHLIIHTKYKDQKTELLKKCHRIFSNLAAQDRVKYKPSEQKIIDTIWAYLCQEFEPDELKVELDETHKIGGEHYESHWPTKI